MNMNLFQGKKAICLFLSVSLMIFCFAPYRLRAEENSSAYYSVECGKEFEVNTVIVAKWNNHSTIDFKIKNTGEEKIDDWYLTFNTLYDVEDIWNASIIDSDENGTYLIKCEEWNQDILPGEEISVGMTVYTENTDISLFSPWYLLNTKVSEVDPDKYALKYEEYSRWETGYSGAIIIETEIPLEDWMIVTDSEYEITEIANANISTEDDRYIIVPADVQNVTVGSSLQLPIKGQITDKDFELRDLHVYSRSYAYNINDDSDQNGIPDYKDYINGQDNTLVITPTPVVTICPTAEPLVTTVPTIEPTQTATPAVTPFVDEKIDSDGDGLTDVIESKIGTDAQSVDTDEDGLSDFIEMIIGYDPLLQDSNSNGINDPDEDIDEDGLSNIKEMSIGSDILSSDTDCDELKDGEEINVYGTDPLLYDTDGDLIGDGDEVKLGKNPTDPSDIVKRIEQTINTKLFNEKDPSIVSVDVTISLSDSIEKVLDVDDVYNVDVYSSDVVGRIGSPVSVECREAFDKAVVVFHYDDSKLGETKEEDLGVLWFNETTGFYEMQEQAVTDVENNTITVELTHFCTFTIVDRVKWESLSSIQYIVPNTEKDYDYYFAFDMSTSMSVTARNNAIKIFEDIVDEMKEGDRISVIYFDTKYAVDGIYSASNKEEIEALKGRVSRNLSGSTLGGDYGSLLLPFQLADAMIRTLPDNDTEKALFILTNDSEQYFIGNYSDTMTTCKERSGFSSHIIITEEKTETDWDFAYQYALATGSDYYKYPEAKGFKDHFIVDYKTISGWNVDSDGDGLPDFIEEQGVKGSNGKTYTSDPFSSDTDGDSVPDNDEYGVVYVVEKEPYDGHVIVRIGNKVVYVSPTDEIEADSDYAFLQQYAAMIGKGGMIIVSRQRSDPKNSDTDNDGNEDENDEKPYQNDWKTIDLGGSSYDVTKSDDGYIHVSGVPAHTGSAYGGNQSWFYNDVDILTGENLNIENTGCGLIASTDVLLYLQYGPKTLIWQAYHEYVIANYMIYEVNYWWIDNPYSISQNYVRAFLTESKVSNECYYVNENNAKKNLNRIIKSLENDKPVILFIDDTLPELEEYFNEEILEKEYVEHSDSDWFQREGLSMYNLDFEFSQSVLYHYVTITGVAKKRDNEGEQVFLRVQSWGKEYYINWDEFSKYSNNSFAYGKIIILD